MRRFLARHDTSNRCPPPCLIAIFHHFVVEDVEEERKLEDSDDGVRDRVGFPSDAQADIGADRARRFRVGLRRECGVAEDGSAKLEEVEEHNQVVEERVMASVNLEEVEVQHGSPLKKSNKGD